jgi:hypothetical protein
MVVCNPGQSLAAFTAQKKPAAPPPIMMSDLDMLFGLYQKEGGREKYR